MLLGNGKPMKGVTGMCEANVYVIRNGREEMLMERVDRIIPGEDGNVFLESVFGERKVVQARIREMELVHHRIILEEILEPRPAGQLEIWLEPATDHGHFHAGEDVIIRLQAGYNMKADQSGHLHDLKVYSMSEAGEPQLLELQEDSAGSTVNLGQEADGLLQIYAADQSERTLYAKVLMEIGHHHHHGVQAIGLPLEIVPSQNSHPRMGESYEVQVLKDGQPWPGAEVRATYASTKSADYPHRIVADFEGKAQVFLTARGNYLFSVDDGMTTSTFTLVKGF